MSRSPAKTFTVAVLPAFLLAAAAHASTGGREFADLSLEELANIQITSVSKRAESLSEASASIFVITGDDIRRSGATTIPEALRLAPNLQVARVDARNYAVTARGFNSPFENKLLVLIDGRTIYSPLFSGVFWDVQNLVMEDIDRIEVISGPGSTLWGANAVNGIINIITRPASQTQGEFAKAVVGNEGRLAAVRHGGRLDNGGSYRVYGKTEEEDDQQRSATGINAADGMRRSAAGFRADWSDSAANYTISGDTYTGRLHQAGTEDIRVAGGNVVARASRRLSSESELSALAYIDYTERNQPGAFIEHLTTVNLEAQQDLLLDRHHLVWGGGYRVGLDHVRNDRSFAFLPGSLSMHWGNLFAQDEYALRHDLKLTAGLKLESNNYTGIEYLPNLRLAWRPAPERLLWGSLSRSVRAPSRIDRDFFAPTNPAIVGGVPQYIVAGGPDFRSEIANIAEVGYRAQPRSDLSYSVTAYAGRYDRLRTLERNPAGAGQVFSNLARASTRGIEAWGSWQATPSWRLSAGAAAQRIDVSLEPGSTDSIGSSGLAINDPSSWWMLRSSHDLPAHTELDVNVRHVNALPRPYVPGYTTVDMQLSWKLRHGIELALIGRNLTGGAHAEFGAPATRIDFDRAVFVRLVARM